MMSFDQTDQTSVESEVATIVLWLSDHIAAAQAKCVGWGSCGLCAMRSWK